MCSGRSSAFQTCARCQHHRFTIALLQPRPQGDQPASKSGQEPAIQPGARSPPGERQPRQAILFGGAREVLLALLLNPDVSTVKHEVIQAFEPTTAVRVVLVVLADTSPPVPLSRLRRTIAACGEGVSSRRRDGGEVEKGLSTASCWRKFESVPCPTSSRLSLRPRQTKRPWILAHGLLAAQGALRARRQSKRPWAVAWCAHGLRSLLTNSHRRVDALRQGTSKPAIPAFTRVMS